MRRLLASLGLLVAVALVAVGLRELGQEREWAKHLVHEQATTSP